MWAINNILIGRHWSYWWRVCKVTIFQSASFGANPSHWIRTFSSGSSTTLPCVDMKIGRTCRLNKARQSSFPKQTCHGSLLLCKSRKSRGSLRITLSSPPLRDIKQLTYPWRSNDLTKKKFRRSTPVDGDDDILHQGDGRWHSFHVLICIDLSKPCTNLHSPWLLEAVPCIFKAG